MAYRNGKGKGLMPKQVEDSILEIDQQVHRVHPLTAQREQLRVTGCSKDSFETTWRDGSISKFATAHPPTMVEHHETHPQRQDKYVEQLIWVRLGAAVPTTTQQDSIDADMPIDQCRFAYDTAIVLREHTDDNLVAVDVADSILYALWGPDRDRAVNVTTCVRQVLAAGGKVSASLYMFEDVAPRTRKLLKVWLKEHEGAESFDEEEMMDAPGEGSRSMSSVKRFAMVLRRGPWKPRMKRRTIRRPSMRRRLLTDLRLWSRSMSSVKKSAMTLRRRPWRSRMKKRTIRRLSMKSQQIDMGGEAREHGKGTVVQ